MAESSPDKTFAPGSQFSSDWLSLRELADHRSRDVGLTERAAEWLASRPARRIVDLGAGSGSNLAHLAPRFPSRQQWLLVDHDRELLDRACARNASLCDRSGNAIAVNTKVADLAALEDCFATPGRVDLVTASALLDLTSTAWVGRLVNRCSKESAALLIVLSYDGQFELAPASPDDSLVREAVNAHQQWDKGLGAALGPRAPGLLALELRAAGYQVYLRASPWLLEPNERLLQAELVNGWAEAANAHDPANRTGIERWRMGHLETIKSGRCRIRVGHQDLFAVPAARSDQGVG